MAALFHVSISIYIYIYSNGHTNSKQETQSRVGSPAGGIGVYHGRVWCLDLAHGASMRGGGGANRAGGCYNKYIWPSVTVSKKIVNKNSKKRLQQPGIEPVTLRSIPSGFVWSVPHSAATNPAECTCINATKLHLYMTACILCL